MRKKRVKAFQYESWPKAALGWAGYYARQP